MKLTKEQVKYLIGIYAAAMTFMAMMVPMPIVANIAQAFPESPLASVQMVVSLPGLIMALSAMVVSSLLASRIHKKTIALVGSTVFMLAGLSPLVFHDSVEQLLCISVVLGAGLGGVQNSTDSLIADYFEGNQRGKIMGVFSVFCALGGVVWTQLSAHLGAENWVNAYWAFAFIIPFIIVEAICLPTGKLEPKRKSNAFSSMPREIVIITAVSFVFALAFQLYYTSSSLIVAERGLGGVLEAGMASTAATMAGLVAGFFVGPLFAKFKNLSMPLMFCIAGVGLTVVLFANSFVALCIGGFIIALGKEAYTPLQGNFAAGNSTPSGRAFNLAIGMAGINVGVAVSPMVATAATAPFGSGLDAQLVFGIVVCLLLAVFGFVKYRKLTPMQLEEQQREMARAADAASEKSRGAAAEA